MTDRERMKRFYLVNHDFNIFCNKNMQSYGRTLDEEMSNPITREYYLSLQRGGCNEPHERKNRGENS